MGVPADHHVVQRLRFEQLPVTVVAHVRNQHQHVHFRTQFGGILRRHQLRIGELQPLETGGIARGMPGALVVGHHADEPDAETVLLDHDVGRQLREGARVAHHVGADDLEIHAVDHAAQKRLPVVEFVVSERRHVVAQAVHQGDHRHSGRGRHVHIGVAGPAVAGIDQHHQLRRVAAGPDGRRQPREILNLGVHVVRRKQHEGPLAGSAGRSDRRSGDQKRPKHSFHMVDTVFHLDEYLSKVQIIPIFTYVIP